MTSTLGIKKIQHPNGTNIATLDSSGSIAFAGASTVAGTLGVTGAITGTLATAAQTNITSVGTLTSFRSTGIDDNADALAMTIDASEHVLVGTTDQNDTSGGAGIRLKSYGRVGATVDGGISGLFNRLTSDGDIIGLYKANSAVGSIGSHGGTKLYIGSGASGLRFTDGSTDLINPYNTSTNADADGTVNLGYDGGRFKDLYLSGGVFLGGTGTANKLDDYEEGTFTPIFEGTSSHPSITYTLQSGYYTKIGKQVTWICDVRWSAWTGGSGTLRVSQLPFTNNGMGAGHYSGNVHSSYMFGAQAVTNGGGYHVTGDNKAYFTLISDGYSTLQAGAVHNSSGHFMIGGTFFTNS